ncbi:MAG: polyprenol phosphomannose-dependent alpha 1,6 mannosyltransferase MptB [Streptosporangiaceae bacterium]
MTGLTSSEDSASSPRAQLAPGAAPRVREGKFPLDQTARVLAWSAGAAIGVAILIMIGVSVAGPSAAVAAMPRPAAGPPWWLSHRLSPGLVTVALWAAAVVGCGGVIAGLAAVARGVRPSTRLLLVGSLVAAAVLTVLPPAGSTDVISYAIDGRIVVTGHNPYVMTPGQLKRTGDPIARLAPRTWLNTPSIYGPLATAEEWAAAELGGTSAARITFWLKLWNALAFGATALALDRLLRSDPARRARAHLLWSVNPLILWAMIAGGHIDGVATALGFCGLLVLRERGPDPVGSGAINGAISGARAFAAGLLVGAATACKVTFGLFGIGVVWACRRSPLALAGALAGLLVALVPGYAIAGWPAVKALAARTQGATSDNFYQLIYRPFGYVASATSAPAGLTVAAALVVVGLAALTLWRLPAPEGFAGLPAVRPALALSLAWLFAWPFQRPWYDVMVICLLALYPASRLDGVVLVRLLAGTTVYTLAKDETLAPHWLNTVFMDNVNYLAPAIRLAAVLALAWFCLSGSWRWRSGPAVEPPAG